MLLAGAQSLPAVLSFFISPNVESLVTAAWLFEGTNQRHPAINGDAAET
jgi:hypothetical protein